MASILVTTEQGLVVETDLKHILNLKKGDKVKTVKLIKKDE